MGKVNQDEMPVYAASTSMNEVVNFNHVLLEKIASALDQHKEACRREAKTKRAYLELVEEYRDLLCSMAERPLNFESEDEIFKTSPPKKTAKK